MDLTAFRASLAAAEPPPGTSLPLRALWWDAKGDWDKAHDCAQEDDGASGAIVHAYLHRKEGDTGNAGYWYRRAGKWDAKGSLRREWEEIVEDLLGR